MYFNSSLVHVDILILKLKLEVQYLGHTQLGKTVFILGKNEQIKLLGALNLKIIYLL